MPRFYPQSYDRACRRSHDRLLDRIETSQDGLGPRHLRVVIRLNSTLRTVLNAWLIWTNDRLGTPLLNGVQFPNEAAELQLESKEGVVVIVAIARRNAAEPTVLAKLRAELPQIVASSAAGNGVLYTRHVEEGYRAFWRRYCAANG
jgi:hypothetical protein